EQRSHSPPRQLDVDFVILNDSLAVPEAVEKDAQCRDIEAALINRVELPAHGLLRLDRKDAVEGAARGDDVKLLVEHDERLANGVDDAVGIGPRCLDCSFGRFPLGYVRKGDNHPSNLGVLGAVGQNITGVPRSVVALDLAVRRHLAGKNRHGVREQATIVDVAGPGGGGRPISVAMMRNSDLAAGVKKRMLRFVSKNNVATPELSRMFCRSFDV